MLAFEVRVGEKLQLFFPTGLGLFIYDSKVKHGYLDFLGKLKSIKEMVNAVVAYLLQVGDDGPTDISESR